MSEEVTGLGAETAPLLPRIPVHPSSTKESDDLDGAVVYDLLTTALHQGEVAALIRRSVAGYVQASWATYSAVRFHNQAS